MKAHRTLIIRRRVEEIPPEQIVRFLQIQEKFRQWATQWYKSGFKVPAPEESPLKYFAVELKYGMRLIPTNGLKNGVWRVPLPFDAQLRENNERDQSRGVLVDLSRGDIRIRKWGGGTIEIRLRKSEIKWITQRLREGAWLKLAYAWIGHTRQTNLVAFNLALVFARETEQYHPIRIMAIDLNALHNGVSWGVVDGERVIRRDTERPDLVRVGKLQKEISRLDSLCAERGGDYCEKAREAKSRLWRLLRRFEDEAAKRLVELAIKQKAAIVVDAPEDESVRELMEGNYTPNRKIYLNIGRLRRRIRELAEWYGVPYREERLYSTVCPRCESRMEELPNRKVKCQRCGFKAPRDKIPLLWAVRRFSELIQPPSFSPSPLLIPVS
ncbi:transposase [Pyrobaculum aerophilum]|uniref:transposase n=1 Tax=Pyrobaculum aerophilum TaxID=13773 RepID=UPI002FDA0B60